MNHFFYGLFLSASMIMAIGAQNLHVIRHGLARQPVFWVAFTCFLCDFLLMSLGVFVVGSVGAVNPNIALSITVLAMLFLVVYGALAFKRAYQGDTTLGGDLGQTKPMTRWHAILVTLGMSLLNPHVYLDTVVVVGGLAAKLLLTEKIFFIAGALVASCTWFFGLAYATRHLLGWLKTPKAGRYFDYFVALVMWALALQLAYFFYQGNLF
jgi:L-lysine exporter family protein LysE/ArgO